MNGSLESNRRLLSELKALLKDEAKPADVEWAVCPPFPYLSQVARDLEGSRIALGAQDACEQDSGAYTGEVSALMLKDVGCRYVIVGHSERRTLYGATDERVVAKVAAVLRAGLTPIVCAGESLAERERGETEALIARQLDVLTRAHDGAAISRCVLAYEPLWAIGTGRTATPQQAQEVHRFMRQRLAARYPESASVPILYGGSVKAANAAELFSMPDVDGGLIGGASLQAAEFAAICRAAATRA